MSDRISLVRWRDAKTDPPGHPGAVWTDQGPAWCAHTPKKVGPWYPEPPAYGQPPFDPQPSVWCDPSPPGDDAPTVKDLRVLLALDTEGDLDTEWNDAYERLRRAIEEAER